MNVLANILSRKRIEIARLRKQRTLEDWRTEAHRVTLKTRSLRKALRRKIPLPVIAEIKRRSPSAGLLSRRFDPVQIARAYARAGASALSILTDQRFFAGDLRFIQSIRSAVRLPLLRKDFILDEVQVYESRVAGADGVLLIAAALKPEELKRLYAEASAVGLEVLVEVHDARDLRKLKGISHALVGINNRNLKTFKVDLKTTRRLLPQIPSGHFIVSESGIRHYNDLNVLRSWGVHAVLVGESLMRHPDPGEALRKLLGQKNG